MGYYPVTPPADDSEDDDASAGADADAAPDDSSSSAATPSTSSKWLHDHRSAPRFKALSLISAAAGLTTPLTALTLPPDVEDEEDIFPNPYLPTFSRTAFLRKRVFAKQEQWSSRIPLK
jgi:phosphatidylinositol-bisphosphatase